MGHDYCGRCGLRLTALYPRVGGDGPPAPPNAGGEGLSWVIAPSLAIGGGVITLLGYFAMPFARLLGLSVTGSQAADLLSQFGLDWGAALWLLPLSGVCAVAVGVLSLLSGQDSGADGKRRVGAAGRGWLVLALGALGLLTCCAVYAYLVDKNLSSVLGTGFWLATLGQLIGVGSGFGWIVRNRRAPGTGGERGAPQFREETTTCGGDQATPASSPRSSPATDADNDGEGGKARTEQVEHRVASDADGTSGRSTPGAASMGSATSSPPTDGSPAEHDPRQDTAGRTEIGGNRREDSRALAQTTAVAFVSMLGVLLLVIASWALSNARSDVASSGTMNGADTSQPAVNTEGAPVSCVASAGTFRPVNTEGMTRQAALMADALYDAAVSCDSGKLVEYAMRERTTLSFGTDTPQEFFALPAHGDRYVALARLLGMEHRRVSGAVLGSPQGEAGWLSPAAYLAADPRDAKPWDEAVAAGLLSEREARELQVASGSGAGYFGYRVGISDAGAWTFFVEGD